MIHTQFHSGAEVEGALLLGLNVFCVDNNPRQIEATNRRLDQLQVKLRQSKGNFDPYEHLGIPQVAQEEEEDEEEDEEVDNAEGGESGGGSADGGEQGKSERDLEEGELPAEE